MRSIKCPRCDVDLQETGVRSRLGTASGSTGERCKAERAIWSEAAPIREIPEGASLIVALRTPAIVRWGFNDWQETVERPTVANSLGLHVVLIDTAPVMAGQTLDFTLRRMPADHWVGQDYHFQIKSSDSGSV
jgi:hypothetical protein